MIFFGVLLALVLAALVSERAFHVRNRSAIRHRIHVNGIRGKSSVTRLIAAGLRGGGLNAWAKVTGTKPAIVDGEGREVAIQRMNGSSLSEQRTVFSIAARNSADALVIECMALQPQYQKVAEESIVRATVGVITNVRPDHLEVYGDQLESVARAIANTIPSGGVTYTTPGPALQIFEEIARKRESALICVTAQEVREAELSGFSYVEHADNLALALRVCTDLGIDRTIALAAMIDAIPDPGVLDAFDAVFDDGVLHVVNALAANDPESNYQLYQRLVDGRRNCPLFLLVHARRDRPLRSIQLGRLLTRIPAALYFISGNDVHGVMTAAREGGVPEERLVSCARLKPERVASRIRAVVESEATLFAIGNTGAGGLETIEAFGAYRVAEGAA
jgi:poly-gamma-glutamate synthase PgsB/CapB